MEYADVDRIYRTLPLENIPWNSEAPPDALAELVRDGTVRPCRTIDLECGAGNYACYLAGLGFEVTGVDSSPMAIRIAEEHAHERGARCRSSSPISSATCTRWPARSTLPMTGSSGTISSRKTGRPISRTLTGC